MILSKSLSSEELSKIEAEWGDSQTVCSLLGHINYLTDTILDLVNPEDPEKKGESDGDD
jgi:hypothetical protein